MSDAYLNFANSALGARVAGLLGLPQPVPLERFAPGQPVVDGEVLVELRVGRDRDRRQDADLTDRVGETLEVVHRREQSRDAVVDHLRDAADARRLDQVAGRLHDWTESEVADFARALHRFRISIESQTNGDDTL